MLQTKWDTSLFVCIQYKLNWHIFLFQKEAGCLSHTEITLQLSTLSPSRLPVWKVRVKQRHLRAHRSLLIPHAILHHMSGAHMTTTATRAALWPLPIQLRCRSHPNKTLRPPMTSKTTWSWTFVLCFGVFAVAVRLVLLPSLHQNNVKMLKIMVIFQEPRGFLNKH